MAGFGKRQPNRLALEKSPYLLQHSTNPVDWYPWGEEAFTKAMKENKLIFLSVGYSTCHWCHVMEKESFENEEIAKILNENFVCIKVDREERPDVDKLYMLFVQAYSGHGGWPMSVWLQPDLIPVAGGTYYPPYDQYGRPGFPSLLLILSKKVNKGRGGWPLSVWLTPELQPVFGGTYFPPNDYHEIPGFKSVLMVLCKQWRENRQKFSESGQRVLEYIEQSSTLDNNIQNISQKPPDVSCNEKCYNKLVQSYDKRYGGFSEAPKFPHLVNLNFLFHMHAREPNSQRGQKALEMCLHTLKMMAKGGIHDHIGGGFSRYSVDEEWHVPHFEKMLYDQGQFAVSYASAYLTTRNEFFADVLKGILSYVSKNLSHPVCMEGFLLVSKQPNTGIWTWLYFQDGGFYSAEDADSLPSHNSIQKKEGAFYVWKYDEIKKLLCKDLPEISKLTYADIFSTHYSVKSDGNVKASQDPHNEFQNQNILFVSEDETATARKFNLPEERVKEILKESKKILLEERDKRPRPHLDDKIITAWNGLMISGFAKAGQVLDNSNYIQRAVGAAKFVRQYLYMNDTKTLLRSCYKSSDNSILQIANPINGFLDDYAFLIRGLLDLYEASFDPTWLEWAESLQESQDRLFWDEGGAGYYSSPSGDSSILVRMKEDHDGAEPSGNSISVHNLLRLEAYLQRSDFKEQAEKLLAGFTSRLIRIPEIRPEMVSALMFYHDGPTQILITGKLNDPDTAALLNVVHSKLIPNRVLALVMSDDKNSILQKKNDIVRTIKPINGQSTAFICHHHTCSLPVNTREELSKLLGQKK
ncbi:hypothetical protein RUM43_008387 [Polyplax serrata]|uniref:Spermatogenesis-associated protein 20-like TRX domain-containing protein n=1 Tax=Polyplax serrata TaxID=468196 RepID=A0AAN8S631_POLSC